MLRPLDSLSLGFAAVLVSAGLLVAAVPAVQSDAVPAEVPILAGADPGCPYAPTELVIVSPDGSAA